MGLFTLSTPIAEKVMYVGKMCLHGMRQYYVYIVTNHTKRVLYTGVTNDLCRRVGEHYSKIPNGFCKKYNVRYLLYAECYPYVFDALEREKQIKKWSRRKKLNLIRTTNPRLDILNPRQLVN